MKLVCVSSEVCLIVEYWKIEREEFVSVINPRKFNSSGLKIRGGY